MSLRINYLKNESVSCCYNHYQIQICIPLYIMNSKFSNDNLSVFGHLENPLNGLNKFKDIYIKFKKTEWVEIS